MTISAHLPQRAPAIDAAMRALVGLFRESPVPMALVDVRSRRVVKANAALERLLGYAQGQLEGHALRQLDAGDSGEMGLHLLFALARGDVRPQRRVWATVSQGTVPVEIQAARLDGEQGTLLALYVRDMRPEPGAGGTEALAGTAAQAPGEGASFQRWMVQKHESLGHLATGFAQELEGILGRAVRSAEVLQAGGSSSPATHAGLGEILGAAREARTLVRELLAYAGKQPMELTTFGIDEVVAEVEDTLREALSSDVGLLVRPGAGGARVHGDRERLKEILLHLVEHAGDSMPDGGYVVVATEAVELDEGFAREHPSTRPGPHALLAVSDTGRGMDEATQARIFEPFFSTKACGTGSGLGLAAVYGMVKQMGGSIWVGSRPGLGTTFRVYLPRVEA